MLIPKPVTPAGAAALVKAYAAKKIETKTANFTAEIGGRYIVESGGNVVITDPTGTTTGQSYEVWVGSGTMQFGSGQTYAASRFSILRRYTGSAWATLLPRLSDDITLAAYTEGVVAIGNSSTAQTIALTNGTFQTVTLTGNCTFTMPTATAGKSFILKVLTGAGGFTGTFTGVKWPENTAPVITTTASRYDLISFIADGTAWSGSAIQNFTP